MVMRKALLKLVRGVKKTDGFVNFICEYEANLKDGIRKLG